MAIEEIGDGLRILQFPSLKNVTGLRHFITTRHGGGSRAPHQGLNLSFRVGDDRTVVADNRLRLFRALELDPSAVVACQQIHGAHIERVGSAHAGCGALDFQSALPGTDALITNTSGLTLLVLAADCVPVLIHDPVQRVVAAAHAGWRGTVQHIAARVVERMSAEYGSDPADLLVCLGPAIGPEDYEVGPEVIEQVRDAFGVRAIELYRAMPEGKALLDLFEMNTVDLERAGVSRARIECSGISTYGATDTFFSDRREGPSSGRFVAGIQLLELPSAR